ncbi:response regulator transcription factor|uniref:response regulator n=1 Tax=Noviherbaspirillum sp. L7-7A TaxID=2850560 RepID=UPI001C2BE36A|nr:response regulator transcription factor [Noviherbaspirillum sp. L7-7A]MBV0879029.1 response regulator transcription factor [Noviherbaspirillum sp. L7-7A]
MPITIAVIEVQPEFLSYLTELIHSDSDFLLVGTAINGHQGLKLVREVDADIYLLDLALPDLSGLDLLSEITSFRPDSNAMIISSSDDEINILSAIERGAAGYLLKSTKPIAFISALHDLYAGASPLSPVVAKKLIHVVRKQRSGKKNQPASMKRQVFAVSGILTERECQVLRELALGLAFLEIAANLSISSHTVAQHVRNIYRKLGVGSRGKAVYEATKLGLLRD